MSREEKDIIKERSLKICYKLKEQYKGFKKAIPLSSVDINNIVVSNILI